MPVPKPQYFTQNGVPLSFGCVFSYEAGSTTPLATYTGEGFGGKNEQNTNPVILSAGGTASIWIQAGLAYTIQVKSAGGTNCALGSTLYTVDGIGGGGSILTTIVTYSVTPIFPIRAENQLFEITLTGDAAAQPLTAVGIVPPAWVAFEITQDNAGGHNFTWPANSVGGAPVGKGANQVTTQMFVWDGTNAIAIGPATEGTGPFLSVADVFNVSTGYQIGGSFGALGDCLQSTGTGTSFVPGCGPLVLANAGVTGTTVNTLTKQTTGGPGAIITAVSDSFGAVGITVSGAGTAGNATIQQIGKASCVFDGAITANDWVVISSSVAGNCHDAGTAPPSTPPQGKQLIGQALSTQGGGGTYQMDLYPPAPPTAAALPPPVIATLNKQDADATPITGTGGDQLAYTYSMPGGSLGAGKCLTIFFGVNHLTGAADLIQTTKFGSTVVDQTTYALPGGGGESAATTIKVCNNAASTTAQWASCSNYICTDPQAFPTENTGSSIVIQGIVNIANTDTWSKGGWTVTTEP